LSYNLIKNNTDDNLFNKCLKEYEMFHPMQQGRPLILLFLVSKKVHNALEQHLKHLKDKVETLKISDLEGENINTAVTLINAAYWIFSHLLLYCKSKSCSFEWSKTLIQDFQTTTLPKFNQIFKDEEKDACQDADKNGGQPQRNEELSQARRVIQGTKSY
jgi:hypothetical protein